MINANVLFVFCFYFVCAECIEVPIIPTVEKSYHTFGEYVIYNEKDAKIVQLSFEENNDSEQKISSLWVAAGVNQSLLLDYYATPGKSWLINGKGCQSYDLTSSKDTVTSLNELKTESIGPMFLPRQLLKLGTTGIITPGDKPTRLVYRNISAVQYDYQYEIKGTGDIVTITSYWSDIAHESPSIVNKVPLGFFIKKTSQNSVTLHVVNLFLFLHDEINPSRFMPKLGVVCPGFPGHPDKRFPDLSALKALGFKSEVVWKGNVTYVDTWLDSENKVLRVDVTPHSLMLDAGDSSRVPYSFVMISSQDAAYGRRRFPERERRVTRIEIAPYFPESIFSLNDLSGWNMDNFFGRNNKNNYVWTGQDEIGGVICDKFQAERKDWPDSSIVSTVSVWEWCFANQEENKLKLPPSAFPTFSLKINIKESPTGGVTDLVATGSQITHHFYDIRSYNPDYLTTFIFDITDFFTDKAMQLLEFRVALTPEILKVLEKNVPDYTFDSAWRKAITQAARLSPSSLRISRVKTMMLNSGGPIEVQFTLLDFHPDLPNQDKGNEISQEEAFQNIEKAVSETNLNITWPPNKPGPESVQLIAIKSSLAVRAGFLQPNQGSPMMVQMMRNQEENNHLLGLSKSSMAIICVSTLLVGLALGVAAMYKVRLGRRAKGI